MNPVLPSAASPRPDSGRTVVRSGSRAWSALVITPVLIAGALVLGACRKKEVAGPPPPPRVEVLEVRGTNLPLAHEIIGQLDSPENVEVRARVEAFVEKVLFTEGTNVNQGDPLFELDRKPFEEKLAQALGQLAQAKASLNKYEKDVERLKPLAEKKAIPMQDLDNAVASVEVGRAAVLSAEALVQSARLDLGYCNVTAPISGRIGAREVAIGNLVGKGEPTLLATISRLDPIWFYCGISEVQYLRTEDAARDRGLKVPDLPVELILANGRVHPEKGRFVFIDRAVDAKTGTIRVRAEFPNAGGVLRPGMFARIRIDLGNRDGSIVIPERAVAEIQGRDFVWVIGPDNKAAQHGVKRSPVVVPGGQVLIEDGLKAGERVVVEGLQKVRDGFPVQPVTAAERAAAEAAAAPGKEAAGHPAKE